MIKRERLKVRIVLLSLFVIMACIITLFIAPYFSWNMKRAQKISEKYIEKQYKFKARFTGGVYHGLVDSHHYTMGYYDEKNKISFAVEVNNANSRIMKRFAFGDCTDTYLEEFLQKKMKEEICHIIQNKWGGAEAKVEIDTLATYTWASYQEPNLRNVEALYRKSYTININVKKGSTKQEEAEKAFEVIKYLKEKNYLPLHVDVNYEVEDGEIKHFSMKDIGLINSANDILALMN